MDVTAEALAAAQDIEIVSVPTPEWGGMSYVRTMSSEDGDAWEQEIVGDDGKMNRAMLRAKLVQRCLCDSVGKLLFDKNGVKVLAGKSRKVVNRLFDAASKLNALTKADEDELLGNSKEGQSAASG